MKGRNSCIDSGRRAIHKAMRSNVRLPLYMRMERAISAPVEVVPVHEPDKPKHWSKKPLSHLAKGFVKRLFNRKTG